MFFTLRQLVLAFIAGLGSIFMNREQLKRYGVQLGDKAEQSPVQPRTESEILGDSRRKW